MYQTINEDIAVAGIYTSRAFIPKKFKWNGQVFFIQEITLISDIKDGSIKKRLYSVLSGANLYRIEFNRDSENWKILEVWCE